ncbi:MAG TPA: hypothetical protein VJS44_09345 [Pyrinomonadaceae bacterium]|nr:hypothetical protein [Pyrinomonadaceae bacterium]
MNTKFTRYTLKGTLSLDEARRTLGDVAAQGMVVRIDSGEGNQTNVTIATPIETGAKAAGAAAAKPKLPAGVKATEVSESDVTSLD